MLDPTMQSRFERLVQVRIAERQKQFPMELLRIDGQAIASGAFHSSRRILESLQAHERELDARTIVAWESLVRVHRMFACETPDTLRDDFKTEMHKQISKAFAELSGSLDESTKRSQQQMMVSLAEARIAVTSKHDIEVDLYVDSLSNSNLKESAVPMTHNYSFYGNVGSVQTGANSIANVVQNLGLDDRTALQVALQQVREALSNAPSVEEQQRRELLEIADECSTQMATESPNNTKLLTMFNVLGMAMQTMASAQPAYQALKGALLPLGITLP